ncbi:MAG: hypothetical protein J2P53_14990, partial [Bradyrhizobiaceae bacterium]|nr:hypothetical protein [Bradyrhizobiaceae bacterium]
MAIVSLLTPPDERPSTRSSLPYARRQVFAFEHMMAHRNLFGAMGYAGNGLSHFTVLPYHLDPEIYTKTQASGWHLNHGQAHQDATVTLPGWFGWWFLPARPPTQVGSFHDFADKTLATPESTKWWTFIN